MSGSGRPGCALAAITLALALVAALVAGPALAAPSPEDQARLDSTIRYLQNVQNQNGGFGGASGRESGQGYSAWVALALAAAGINPRDQAKPGGVDAYGYLVGHFQAGLREEIAYPKIPTTAFERELMVVNAAGTDPHEFAGYDLVDEILDRARDDGSFPYVPGGRGEINDTVFAIVALAPVKEPLAEAAVQNAAGWLISQQDEGGGWSWEVKGGRPEADLTGAAIQALNAAGRHDTPAQQRGFKYLREMQNPDGGFPEFPGEAESNVASTAWVAQAIWSAGQNPEDWTEGEPRHEPLSFMASLQEPDGHVRWKASEDSYGVWMTAYVAPAFAGQAWPIPEAPRSEKGVDPPPEPGQGAGDGSGDGVVSGGGGHGAPLFSQPKPQSKGKTPGGSRIVHNENKHPRNHSRTLRALHPQSSQSSTASEPGRRERAGAGAVDAGAGIGGRPGSGSPATPAAGERPAAAGGGREVTGALVGSSAAGTVRGALAFGAPGLRSAGVEIEGESWQAVAIGAAALLFGLGGVVLERRRGPVLS